jgi:hypothetical protein
MVKKPKKNIIRVIAIVLTHATLPPQSTREEFM